MRLKHTLRLSGTGLFFLWIAGCSQPYVQEIYAPPPAVVWGVGGYPAVAYGSYGGYGAWNHGTGVAYGAYGGSAAWSNGSGYAHGTFGGSAAWSHGSGVAYGPHGGSAAWHR